MILTRAQLAIAGIVSGVLLIAVIVLSLKIWGAHIGPLGFDGLTDKLEDCHRDRNELRGIIAEADRAAREAQKETAKRIERLKVDDGKARRIESAPLPGDCKTPREIMELEI